MSPTTPVLRPDQDRGITYIARQTVPDVGGQSPRATSKTKRFHCTENEIRNTLKSGNPMLTISIEINGKEVLSLSPLSLIAQAALQSDIHFAPDQGSVITCRVRNGAESVAISEALAEDQHAHRMPGN